jgi:hypothetical protein
MKRIRLMVVICTLCFIGACGGRPGDGREGGTDKREWSILQANELKTRDKAIKSIEFLQSNHYNLVCVPSDKSGRRIWIMMDAKSPPFYKQIPDGNYSLTKEELSEIEKKTNPTSTVVEALRSHIGAE